MTHLNAFRMTKISTLVSATENYVKTLAFAFLFGLQVLSASITLAPAPAMAQAATEAQESYSDRPSILELPAKAHPELGGAWEKAKRAHFAFAAELLELYPSQDLYFLARDSELLYDSAVLLAAPHERSRLHLINVSRGNMRDPNLKNYLSQNGISDEALLEGKQVIFVDTGFAGTIPRVIQEAFSEKVRPNLKTHLIVSSNASHPSSRSFLIHITPLANQQTADDLHGSIINYEHMPRYFERSNRYELKNGAWVATSPKIAVQDDGAVSKLQAIKYMQDLKMGWSDPSIREFAYSFRAGVKSLMAARETAKNGRSDLAKDAILQFLAAPSALSTAEKEAMVRDLFDAQKNLGVMPDLNLADLGLAPKQMAYTNKKFDLIEKYPEWKAILEDPEGEIPKLVADKRFDEIGALYDANIDADINTALEKAIFSSKNVSGAQKALQLLVIKKSNATVRTFFIVNKVFNTDDGVHMSDQLKFMVEVGDSGSVSAVMSLIEKRDVPNAKELMTIAYSRFSDFSKHSDMIKPFLRLNGSEFDDLFLTFINKANKDNLFRLSQLALKRPMTLKNVEALEIIARRIDMWGYTENLEALTRGIEQVLKSNVKNSSLKSVIDIIEKRNPNLVQKYNLTSSPSHSGLSCKTVFQSL